MIRHQLLIDITAGGSRDPDVMPTMSDILVITETVVINTDYVFTRVLTRIWRLFVHKHWIR